jgi:hypothetical protein
LESHYRKPVMNQVLSCSGQVLLNPVTKTPGFSQMSKNLLIII